MKYSIFFGCLFLGLTTFAQTLIVSDSVSGQPLELVSVASQSPRAFAVSNAHGEVEALPFNGSAKIEFRLMGYKSLQISYTELENQGFKVFLKPGITLTPTVVSASRSRRPEVDVPQRVTSIGPREISLRNPQTAADLIGSTGEVFIQKSQQGGGSPLLRGFATNRVLIAVDGIRMNNAIFRSGNLQNIISLDPFAIEQAEVLFGPGSVMYGSDAIGGVMSFQTLSPQLSLSGKPFIKGSAVARTSSANNELTRHFDVNIGWKKWALLSSFSHNRFDHLRMGSYGPADYLRPFYVQRIDSTDRIVTNSDPKLQIPTAYEQVNLMQKIRFRPNTHWDFTYGFHYSETSDYGRYDRHIRHDDFGGPRSAEWYYGPQVWAMNSLNVTNNSSNLMYDELVLRIAYQYFAESRHDRSFGKSQKRHRYEEVQALSLNLDFRKDLGKRSRVNYGLEAVHNDVFSKGSDENVKTGDMITGPARYPQAEWKSYAAFVTLTTKLSEKFSLHGGARYNYVLMDAQFVTQFYPFPFTEAHVAKGALTGSLGAVYKPVESWVIAVNLSSGFRAPNVDDLGKVFDSEPGKVIVPNPNLKPEYARNAEITMAKQFGSFLKLDFSGYYTLLSDAMVRRDFTLNGSDSLMYDGQMSRIQSLQNAASASVQGVQAGFELTPLPGLSLSAHANYQVGEEELEDGRISSLRHAAPAFGVAKMGYQAKKLRLELSLFYSEAVSFERLAEEERGKTELYTADKNGNPWSPAWYSLNINAMYQLTDSWQLTAGVENITDRRYRPYSSGMAAAGRNLVLAVRAGF